MDSEQAHLRHAVSEPATVTATNDVNGTITVLTRSGHRYTLETLDTYGRGSVVPVLTDPDNPDENWVRLIAEPDDATDWESTGLAALLLAGLLVCRADSARRARRRLLAGEHPALATQVRTDEFGRVTVFAADDRVYRTPLAVIPGTRVVGQSGRWHPHVQPAAHTGPDADEIARFGRLWRGENRPGDSSGEATPYLPAALTGSESATLLGRFATGSWVAVVTDSGTLLLPDAPLRRPGHGRITLPWRRNTAEATDRSSPSYWLADPSRRPVDAVGASTPGPPVTARRPLRVRLSGALVALAGLAVAPTVVLIGLPDDSWIDRLTMLWGGGWLVAAGVTRVTWRLILDRRQIIVARTLTVLRLPWERVHGVRIDGHRVAVAYEPTNIVVLESLRAPGYLADPTGRANDADRVAIVMSWLRELALAAGRTGARPRTVVHLPVLVALLCYATLVAAAAWWHSRH